MLQLCSNAWAWRLFPNPLLSLTYDLTCFMTEIIIYFSQRNCYLTITHFMSLISLISLENIRKLLVFCFQGVSKEISGMKWVNEWMNNENNLLITPNPPNLLNIMTQCLDPLSANPTKWSNRHRQFVGKSKRIVWVCLTILWVWRLKGYLMLLRVMKFVFQTRMCMKADCHIF